MSRPVLCAGENTPSKRLSDSSSVTDSGQLGIKTWTWGSHLTTPASISLQTRTFTSLTLLIKTTSSKVRRATRARNAIRENESSGPRRGSGSSSGGNAVSSATLAQTADEHDGKNSRDKDAGSGGYGARAGSGDRAEPR